ncbi:MAG: hypothetical protein AAF645_24005 [Myxococcota bacterium]
MRFALLFIALGALSGCPRDTTEPERPLGQPCQRDEDCLDDGGTFCGAIRACVDQVCEAVPSRVLPCE